MKKNNHITFTYYLLIYIYNMLLKNKQKYFNIIIDFRHRNGNHRKFFAMWYRWFYRMLMYCHWRFLIYTFHIYDTKITITQMNFRHTPHYSYCECSPFLSPLLLVQLRSDSTYVLEILCGSHFVLLSNFTSKIWLIRLFFNIRN